VLISNYVQLQIIIQNGSKIWIQFHTVFTVQLVDFETPCISPTCFCQYCNHHQGVLEHLMEHTRESQMKTLKINTHILQYLRFSFDSPS